MNTKTLNTYEKLWLANRASHNMALAGPTAFWLASGHREARPLVAIKLQIIIIVNIYLLVPIKTLITLQIVTGSS